MSKDLPNCLLSCSSHPRRLGKLLASGSPREIVQCNRCGLAQVHPLPSQVQLNKFYQKFHEIQSITSSPTKEQKRLDKIEQHQKPGALLDVGAGKGDFLAVARKRGWQVSGFEISNLAARKVTQKHGIPIKTGQFKTSRWGPAKFDVISLHSVIEHTHEPLEILHICVNLLKPQGLLVVSFPNLNSFEWHFYKVLRQKYPGFIAEHLWYWTPTSVRKTLKLLDLDLREITSQHFSPREKFYKKPEKAITWLAKNLLEHTRIGGKLLFGNVIYAYAQK